MIYFLKEKDLKQYMDDCGNIMSVHNVKVLFVGFYITRATQMLAIRGLFFLKVLGF